MLGGLGGALAGNWLYDQFSGRHGNVSSADAVSPPTTRREHPIKGVTPSSEPTTIPVAALPGTTAVVGGGDVGGGDWGGGVRR